jgi:hypothetical protein
MPEDQIDSSMKILAQHYKKRLMTAQAAYPDNPKRAGTEAGKQWIVDVRSLHGKVIEEPGTGVDTGRGGYSRFDVVFVLNNMEIYVEVQATDYNTGHKPVQTQGQIIGFAHVSAGRGIPARYFIFIGFPSQIVRWSRKTAQDRLRTGNYEPQVVMDY